MSLAKRAICSGLALSPEATTAARDLPLFTLSSTKHRILSSVRSTSKKRSKRGMLGWPERDFRAAASRSARSKAFQPPAPRPRRRVAFRASWRGFSPSFPSFPSPSACSSRTAKVTPMAPRPSTASTR